MPTMTKGAKAAEQINEEVKASRPGRYRMEQLRLKDGDKVWLRFLTPADEWITAGTHQYIDTKDKPEGWSGDNWPKAMWAIDRRDRIFREYEGGKPTDRFEEGYGDCYICDTYRGVLDKFKNDKATPAPQTYGLAVMREEVRNGAGSVIGFKDVMVEFKGKDGTHQIPKIVLVNQKYVNFWSSVDSTLYLDGAIVGDKDFSVKREGNDYTIAIVNQTVDHQPGTTSWSAYDNALELVGWKGLEDFIVEHASRDWYRTWFVPGEEPEGGYGRNSKDDDSTAESGSAQAAESTPAAPSVSQEDVSGFRTRLNARGAQQG